MCAQSWAHTTIFLFIRTLWATFELSRVNDSMLSNYMACAMCMIIFWDMCSYIQDSA